MINNFTALDFETSYGHIPCSIGIVEFVDGIAVSEYYSLIKPIELKFSPINSNINGIYFDDVINEREFDEIWYEIEHYFQNKNIVTHNASTDISILEKTLKYYQLPKPNYKSFCTLALSRNKFQIDNYRLSTLANYLEIKQHNYHNALDDAHVCGQLFNHLSNDAIEFKLKQKVTARKTSIKVFKESIFANKSNNLEGKTFLFTGSLTQFTRDEAQKMVEQNGGKNISAVSKNLNYLIAGEKAGSKLKKAEALGTVQVLTEEEFLEMIQS